MPSKKEELVYRAKMAEQADRHDDMAQLMREAVEQDKVVSIEERNLLSFAYKHIVGTRRRSWRVIVDMQKRLDTPDQQKWVKAYREKIEAEMRDICNEVLKTMDKIVPHAIDDDAKVFFLKMKADYLRYLAEIAEGTERQAVVEKSRQAYSEAFDIAKEKMLPTNPIRLGLALNFSVFYYEIALVRDKACELAKKAFDDALVGLNGVDEESHKDSNMIMQLLRDNLQIWSDDTGNDDPEGAEKEASDSFQQRADLSRVCFDALLSMSRTDSPDIPVKGSSSTLDKRKGSKSSDTAHSLGATAIASLLSRCKQVLNKYAKDEQGSGHFRLPQERIFEAISVLRAVSTLIDGLAKHGSDIVNSSHSTLYAHLVGLHPSLVQLIPSCRGDQQVELALMTALNSYQTLLLINIHQPHHPPS